MIDNIDISAIIKAVKRVRTQITVGYNRFLRHFTTTLKISGATLGVLSFITSILCVVALTIYIGFDHSIDETRLITRLLRTSQIVFILNVSFNLVFNFKETSRNTKTIKWIADILIFITVIPIIYHPQYPWLPWLEHLIESKRFLYPVLGLYSILSISNGILRVLGKRTNPSMILSCSFIFLILSGSFLLMMPRCTYEGISYIDSLFVSTSAVCITGLSPIDISSTFTPFGILIVGILAQVGGLGLMTFTSFFALFFSGSSSIYSQLMVKDMIYTKTINSLLPTLLYILGFTMTIEAIGAIAFFFTIDSQLVESLNDKIIFSLFHAMSSFCNLGFSNVDGGFSNPVLLHGNQSVYIVASVLVFAGGIGFPILVNFRDVFFRKCRRIWATLLRKDDVLESVHALDMNTKIALFTTITILIISVGLFMLLEYNNTLASMTLYQKTVQSVFNALAPRSSGFSSVNPGSFLNITVIMLIFLMWIGGASQSTAGGIKVNTFATMLLNLRAIITGSNRVVAFKRTVSSGSIRHANAVVGISILSYFIFSMTLVALEPTLSVKDLLFESASALFTVGSSLGITPMLSISSKILLCVAMFLGRVGLLSLLVGFFGETGQKRNVIYPTDDIIIN
ncbi:MAG: potassium transporter [Muribaculaceae bacterium]|nr:potassium transporter [Muribaculaceae bacterium]